MSSLRHGDIRMAGMKSMGQGLLPPLVTCLWVVAAVSIAIMAASMAYMFAAMQLMG